MTSTPAPTGSVPVSRWTWLAGGAVAVLSLVVAIVLFNAFGDAGPRAAIRSYQVLSDSAIRVDFVVTKDKSSTVLCTVRARDRDGTETGIALVLVGPSRDGSVLVTRELRTAKRANTGEVTGCSADPGAPASPAGP